MRANNNRYTSQDSVVFKCFNEIKFVLIMILWVRLHWCGSATAARACTSTGSSAAARSPLVGFSYFDGLFVTPLLDSAAAFLASPVTFARKFSRWDSFAAIGQFVKHLGCREGWCFVLCKYRWGIWRPIFSFLKVLNLVTGLLMAQCTACRYLKSHLLTRIWVQFPLFSWLWNSI